MGIRLTDTTRLLLSLYIPSMVMSFGQGMVVPTVPVLATHFEVSVGLAAQIVTAQLLGRVIILIPAGVLIDRLGRRPMLIAGPVVIAAGALITALSPNFWVLLAAQVVIGAGNNLWQTAREIAAIDLVRPEQRGRLLSGFMGMGSVGMSIGPLLGGWMTQSFGFHTVFWAYAAMGVATLFISFTIPETAARVRSANPSAFSIGGLKDIDPYWRPTFIALIFNSFAAFMRSSMANAMLPLYAGSMLGYSPVEVGTLFTAMGIVNFIMIVPTGVISDSWGRKAVVVPSAVFGTLAFLGIPLFQDLLPLVLLSGLLGLSNGLGLGTMASYSYDVIPPEARGRMQAFRRTIGETGGVLGPMAGGLY
ncbi:MAG: MFS transporter, partial [Chloroflexota bacterium]